MGQTLPPEIERQLASWGRLSTLLRLVHVTLGLIGVVCPLVVATFTDSIATSILRGLSFASAAAVAIFAAFEIGANAARFREAWKHLNAASIEFRNGVLNLEGLMKAYREGEVIIGQMKADPFERPGRTG